MKQHNLIYATVAVCFILASCSKTDADSSSLGRSLIGFNTVSTKAASAYPTGNPFITTSYKLASGKTWDANKADAGSPIINQEVVTYNSTYNYWKTATDYYWPTDGSTLTFFSYSPSTLKGRASVSTDGVGISSWNVEIDTGDILVADIAKDKTKNESYAGFNGVPTHFRNKLCKLTFRVAASDLVDEGTEVYLKKATLSGFYAKGDYAKGGTGAESWGNRDNQQTDYVLFESTGTDGDMLTSDFKAKDWKMIPQSTTGITLTIEYSTKIGTTVKDETVTLSINDDFRSGIWGMGQHITYSMKIGAGRIPILFDGSAEEWKAVDGGIIEIE